MPGLIVRYDGAETVVAESEVAVIGAADDALVHIAKPGISRHHAQVKYDGARWILEDTASRNGTFVGGSRVGEMPVGGPTAVRLGHPVEGELLELEPEVAAPASRPVTLPLAPPVATPAESANDVVAALLAGQQRLLLAVWVLVAAVVLLAVTVVVVTVIS